MDAPVKKNASLFLHNLARTLIDYSPRFERSVDPSNRQLLEALTLLNRLEQVVEKSVNEKNRPPEIQSAPIEELKVPITEAEAKQLASNPQYRSALQDAGLVEALKSLQGVELQKAAEPAPQRPGFQAAVPPNVQTRFKVSAYFRRESRGASILRSNESDE